MESNPSRPPLTTDHYPPTTLPIGGLQVTLYGLTTLPPTPCTITLVSLLHPRLETASYMAPLASSILSAATTPTLCLSFDQRNHGTRLLDPLGNETWRGGNPKHALDLFSCYQGTAMDLSHIIDFLQPSTFPNSEHTITRHIVAGVSLGGHAAWVAAVTDPRIEAAGVIIGCPDFCALMEHRAGKSRLEAFTVGGSTQFPKTLLDTVRRYDPAAMGVDEAVRRLKGKKVLCLSGGVDKLVPYECSKRFLGELKEKGVNVVDRVFDGVGHECTDEMVKELAGWVDAVVAGKGGKGGGEL
ncbi:alpha/beta-hydrolase [Wilcoxina mikolae CBS 423.85]|nr:alpha/beta-hydrolase [Wilcoxina mikolae CBS 423.85]